MNDIRRTILWVIFGFSMVLLWDQWQVFNGQKPTFFPGATTSSKSGITPPAVGVGSAAAVPVASSSGVQPAAGASAVPLGAPPAATQTAREKVVVSTDVFALTFDSEGGSLVKSSFVKFKDMADKNNGFVLLDESISGSG